jgi:ABC-2 type transport system ATP-binding protein
MVLSIQHLSKTYQDGKKAVADFNWEIERGVYGLLGPNGAGKSTLLEILSLNLMPTSGAVLWDGWNVQKHATAFRRALGYLPQTYGFYPELTARQMLGYLGRLHGLYGRHLRNRMNEVLEVLNLTAVRNRKIKTYSGGTRQRLAIAQALLHEPQLLVIDEPTTGLDPSERVFFRNLLFDLGKVCVVLLSTHIVKDVEFTCHAMTLLYGGEQRFTGLPADFIRRVEGRVFEREVPLADFKDYCRERCIIAIREKPGTVVVRHVTRQRPSCAEDGDAVRPNLEDAYVDFVGERQGEESDAAA